MEEQFRERERGTEGNDSQRTKVEEGQIKGG